MFVGTIIDDCVVTRMREREREDHFFMVVNGANKHIDINHLSTLIKNENFESVVNMEAMFEKQLLALQVFYVIYVQLNWRL